MRLHLGTYMYILILGVARYLQNYVDNIFSGAWEPRETTPLPVDIPMPTLEQGMKLNSMLSEVRN